jgi:hypothetical protein
MSKYDSDHLYSLIKSLGKAEKRHFKVHSSKHVLGGGNIYVKLFDAICAQKTYDEKALLTEKIFHDLPSLKHRLYNAVLRSLEEYHSSVEIEIKSSLIHIEILFNKSLFPQCLKKINTAKKNTEKYELFELLMEVLRWEHRVAVKQYDIQLRVNILKEQNRVLKLFINLKTYLDLANSISLNYQQHGSERSLKGVHQIKKLLKHPLLQNESKALSFRARQNFYACHYGFSLIKGDFVKAQQFSKRMATMYIEHPYMISTYTSAYLTSINNFLITANGLNQYNEMLYHINQLEVVRKGLKSSSERALAFFYLTHLLNYYTGIGLFSEATNDLRKIEHEMQEHELYLNQLQKTILYLTISQIYFGQENYKKTLHWLNKINALGEMKVRTDIESFFRIFYLIVHYEMKSDRDLLISLFKSTHRFLYKRQGVFKFESIMLNFIKENMVKGIQKKNMKSLFSKLKSKLEPLMKDPYENQVFQYFDFISWLKSKIENRSFAEMVKEKAIHNPVQ